MPSLTRRIALKLIGFGSALVGVNKQAVAQEKTAAQPTSKSNPTVSWSNANDRVFLGGQVWANPMENWEIKYGAAECSSTGADRNIQLLTHQITNKKKNFQISVTISQVEVTKRDLGAGFKIGVKSELNEHRSNAFAKNGIKAGIVDGSLLLGNQSKAFDGLKKPVDIMLELIGKIAIQRRYGRAYIVRDRCIGGRTRFHLSQCSRRRGFGQRRARQQLCA